MQLTPEQVQSINVLLSAVQVAQRRGAFSLQDAHTLQEAIDALVPREEQERQAAASQAADAEGGEGESAVSMPEGVEVAASEDEDCCDDEETCEHEEDGQPAADSE